MVDVGYGQSLYDYFTFTKNEEGDKAVALVYVDDLLITRSSDILIQEAKRVLH